MFHDEVDVVFGTKKAAENNEDLRGLYNNGYQRDRPMWRCVGVGTHQHSESLEVFSMAMLVAIKHIPTRLLRPGRQRRAEAALPQRAGRPIPHPSRRRLLEALQKRLARLGAQPRQGRRRQDPSRPAGRGRAPDARLR